MRVPLAALADAEERADRVEEAWVGQVMAYEAKIEAAEQVLQEIAAYRGKVAKPLEMAKIARAYLAGKETRA